MAVSCHGYVTCVILPSANEGLTARDEMSCGERKGGREKGCWCPGIGLGAVQAVLDKDGRVVT